MNDSVTPGAAGSDVNATQNFKEKQEVHAWQGIWKSKSVCDWKC